VFILRRGHFDGKSPPGSPELKINVVKNPFNTTPILSKRKNNHGKNIKK